MGKFPFKRPRIISKKFPELDSSIDGVTKSLNDLVFSYHEQIQNALSKKHWMMAFSSIVLLLVLGSFISIRGKADTSVFYPETCLGGWINPENAQGEQQTTSNGDESQFTKDNSAVLPKNTNAEMYCGNFKGKFNVATKPTKIIVSLALTKGSDLKLEDTLESGLVAATSTITDFATTSLLEASSTDVVSSSTREGDATSTLVDTAIATPGSAKNEGPTIIDGVVQSLQDTIQDLFGSTKDTTTQTDTVVIPPPVPADTAPKDTQPQTPATDSPTSFGPMRNNFVSHFVDTVFAQEDSAAIPAPETRTVPSEGVPPQTVPPEATPEESQKPVESIKKNEVTSTSTSNETVLGVSSSTEVGMSGTTSESLVITGSSTASLTELSVATGTDIIATSTEDNQFQNNFLEVLYTFDGVTWTSLGELNEISMKYRTFEIPVTASTSWNDLAHLQIKVQAKKHELDTPTVYLDGIKVEVLYETELDHAHPDFSRDTILNDVTIDDIRIVTIINNDNKETEIWYMVLGEDGSTVMGSELTTIGTSTASSTDIVASSNIVASIATSSTIEDTDVVLGDSTSTVSSTSPVLVPSNNLFKRVWKKYHGKDVSLSTNVLIEEIKKQEASEKETELDIVPDFASDTIKRMKGASSHNVLVQIERGTTEYPRDELWLYDVEKNTEERIGKSTTTNSTIAVDSPIGIKEGRLFWISIDKDLVYAYNLENKTLLEEKIPIFNADKGERAELYFSDLPWKVIIGTNEFYFYSTSTGEVFSDEDASVVETLRASKKLDLILNKEELGGLNLPVSADESTETP